MSALLALLASLLWGAADFLGGTASRTLPVLWVLALSQLTALLGLVPVALLTGATSAPRDYLVPAVAAGLVGLVALGAFYRALAVGTMGVVAPIAALGALVPVLAGLLQGEAPSTGQLLGMAVALGGVVLASGPELRGAAGALPVLLAGVAAVGFGAVLVLIDRAADHGITMTLLAMRAAAVTVLAGLLGAAAARGVVSRGVPVGSLPLLAAVGAGDVLANGAFALATARAGALVSVTSVLASLYPVVTVLLARQVHGERLRSVQVVGVSGAFTGVALAVGYDALRSALSGA